jgi:hypothetical protein
VAPVAGRLYGIGGAAAVPTWFLCVSFAAWLVAALALHWAARWVAERVGRVMTAFDWFAFVAAPLIVAALGWVGVVLARWDYERGRKRGRSDHRSGGPTSGARRRMAE